MGWNSRMKWWDSQIHSTASNGNNAIWQTNFYIRYIETKGFVFKVVGKQYLLNSILLLCACA